MTNIKFSIIAWLILSLFGSIEAFKSHINSHTWDSISSSRGPSSSSKQASSSAADDDRKETPPVSSTVRRWNQAYNNTESKELENHESSQGESPENCSDEEPLLIVQESDVDVAGNAFYELDLDQAVFGREERVLADQRPQIMVPTFASPNAYRFQYKRYHPTMAPPPQLFHAVTMGVTRPKSSALYASTSADGRSKPQFYKASTKPSMEALTEGSMRFNVTTSNNLPLWHYWRPLLKMCRLQNLPGVLVFHVVAVHLIHRVAASQYDAIPSLLSLIVQPGMLATLLATMLIACISMLFNDYYDTKSGLDFINEMAKLNSVREMSPKSLRNSPGSMTTAEFYSSALLAPDSEPHSEKPLVTGELPRRVARNFITLMAIMTLTTTMVLPGILPKLAVLVSGIIVYFYTESLKPITWIKNISCAGLIAASPLVSGVAAWHILSLPRFGAALSSLIRLMACIFTWSMSREIVMDITDCKFDSCLLMCLICIRAKKYSLTLYTTFHCVSDKGDKLVGVQTIAVRHGKRFASKVSLVFATLFAILTTSGPSTELLGITTSPHLLPPLLRFILSLCASSWMVFRALQVCRDEGEHAALGNKLVQESMITALLAIGSFV